MSRARLIPAETDNSPVPHRTFPLSIPHPMPFSQGEKG